MRWAAPIAQVIFTVFIIVLMVLIETGVLNLPT
jgi:hypothetical protein